MYCKYVCPPSRRPHANRVAISTLVKDVVTATVATGLTDPHERFDSARRPRPAQLSVRRRLRERDRDRRVREGVGHPQRAAEKVHERPDDFLDRWTIEGEGVDAATRNFIAGMTDRMRSVSASSS